MGGVCCVDHRPTMKIHLDRGQLEGKDSDGESDAYVEFRYGNLERQRFEKRMSSTVGTAEAKCVWDEVIEFHIGTLGSTLDLEITVVDRDLLTRDEMIGKAVIYHGYHPKNEESEIKSDVQTPPGEENAKHFLPTEWNMTKHYEVELFNHSEENPEHNGLAICGKLHFSIILDDHQTNFTEALNFGGMSSKKNKKSSVPGSEADEDDEERGLLTQEDN